MNIKLFVTPELAKQLQQKGYEEEVLAEWSDLSYPINDSGNDFNTSLCLSIDCDNNYGERKMLWIDREAALFHWTEGTYREGDHSRCEFSGDLIPAPTIQEAVDWFRTEHGLVLDVFQEFNDVDAYTGKWEVDISELGKYKQPHIIVIEEVFADYYDAWNKAIEEALKIIPQK